VGVRWPPGTPSRLHGGEDRTLTGLDAIAQYGIGQRDPLTGLYEAYDIPAGHAAAQTQTPGERKGKPVTWPELIGQWSLLECDFGTQYGVELEDAIKIRTWRWFRVKCEGILAAETRINRYFFPPDTP
jgi:hypothetical protein